MSKLKTVFACVPVTWDYVPLPFLVSWCGMQRFGRDMYDMVFATFRSCYYPRMRDKLAQAAREDKPDYILWLDVDQTYPANTVKTLIDHVDSGKLVVGGVTPFRDDGSPMVWQFYTGEAVGRMGRRRIELNSGTIKVDCIGSGGTMTHPEVFETLDPPYFDGEWNSKYKERSGEDVGFYLKCRDAGIDVWCDTGLQYEHLVLQGIGHQANSGATTLTERADYEKCLDRAMRDMRLLSNKRVDEYISAEMRK